jgi:hypothetical protein
MIIKIKTEYEEIFLYSSKKISKILLNKEINKIKDLFIKWEVDKNEYFLKNNLDEKELNYQRDNISYGFQKHGTDNKFMQKRLQDLQKHEEKINNYYHLKPHPKYSIEKELSSIGLKDIKLINVDAEINIDLNSNNLNIKY